MNNYIDIHSHRGNSLALTIVNCFPSEIEVALQNQPQQYFSVGLHPWYIKSDYEQQLEIVNLFANNSQVLAIGETGLDKLCDTPFELQRKVFIQQAKFAENIQKPLIIHCVKAYSELIQLKKELCPTMPWILHGYRGNKQTTQLLLPHNFFFSFGKGISLLQDSLNIIPLNKLFLETDVGDTSIEEMYSIAAQLLKVDLIELQKAIQVNFKNVFIGNPGI